MMKIEIIDNQKVCGIKRRAVTSIALFFMKKACGRRGITGWTDITFQFTDNADIQEINKAVFRSDNITDVISSTYNPIPGEQARLSGEIAINVQLAFELTTAKHRAPTARRWTASDELALYIAHGCDHLSGEDDHGQTQRRRMRRRELRWMMEARRMGLLNDLITIREPRRNRMRKI